MFTKIITLFALVSSANVAKKPTKAPTVAPTFHVERTTYSKDFKTFLPISDANGKYTQPY